MWTATLDTSSYTHGDYTFWALAYDAYSIHTDASVTVTFNNPANKPTVTSFTASPNQVTVGQSTLLTAARDGAERHDLVGEVLRRQHSCSAAGRAATGTYTLSTSGASTSVGSHFLNVIATDTNSNTDEQSLILERQRRPAAADDHHL